MLHDNQGVYGQYNIPGSASPYPRDFILDENGIVHMAKTEYEPGTMIAIIEELLHISPVDIEPHSFEIPEQLDLITVSPNPFNPDARIKIVIHEEGIISLGLFDIRGRKVHEFIKDRTLTSGDYDFHLRGENLSSGVYFLYMTAQQERHIQKIVKLR